jgi:Domain of unknown function (DUF4402)
MKLILKFSVLATVMLLFTAITFGQGPGVSATATASATIITPLAITKTFDMNFGNLAVNANPGTVALSAAATPTRTPGGGVTLIAGGTITAATFTVTGLTGTTYSISLPADGVVSLTGPGAPMAANTFVSTPTVAAGGSLATGTETLYVGATLSVAGGQTPGAYSSAAFTVTVNYN